LASAPGRSHPRGIESLSFISRSLFHDPENDRIFRGGADRNLGGLRRGAGVPDSRRGEVTKLDSVMETDGTHVFSGVENGRVVSVIITDSGGMTLSIINDGVVWSVFGHALPEGKLKEPPADKRAQTDGE